VRGGGAHADQCVRVCVCVGGVWSSGRWVVGWGRAWWWWRWEEGVVGVGAGVGVGGRWLGRVSGWRAWWCGVWRLGGGGGDDVVSRRVS
jgi:hypothetical protein